MYNVSKGFKKDYTEMKGHGGKREGAGRKRLAKTEKTKPKTWAVRVSTEISKEQIAALPSLLTVLAAWRAKCAVAKSDAARYDFLRDALEELKELGF